MNVWKSLDHGPLRPLFRNYYSSDKPASYASRHELQELKILHDYSHHLEFDIDFKPSLLQLTRSLGQSAFMSQDNFHSFVNMVANSTTVEAGGSVKSLIDAFVYRALAMIEPPEYATFDAGYELVGVGVPSEEPYVDIEYIPTSFIDYRIVVSQNLVDADEFLKEGVSYPTMIQHRQLLFHLSVLEPKLTTPCLGLERGLPHLLLGMHAAAKTLQKAVMRGALTNGSEWIFLILSMNPVGVRASYRYTEPILYTGNWRVCEQGSVNDIITGILASWIRRSHEPYSDKDWLKYFY